MKYIFYYVIFIVLLVATTLSFALAIYSKDMFFFTLAVLLIMASFLLFLEIKKIRNDPFLS
jgi:hypothetical protein